MSVCLLLVLVVILLYTYATWTHNFFDKLHIPYHRPLPFFGNMGAVIFRKSTFRNQLKIYCAKFKGCKVFGFFEFRTPYLVITDPRILKLVLVRDFDYFTDRCDTLNDMADPLTRDRSLTGLKGDHWKNMRATLSPAFASSKIKTMYELVEKCGHQMADHLSSLCKKTTDGVLVTDVNNLFRRFVTDVISTAAYGVHCDSLVDPHNEFYLMAGEMGHVPASHSYLLFALFPKLMQTLGVTIFPAKFLEFFRELVYCTIDKRDKEGIYRPDMIHHMMQARMETHDPSKTKLAVMSKEDIAAQALLFFLAGFHATSMTPTHLCMMLAIHPDIQQRVQEEIDNILEENGGEITYEGLQRMTYTDMVISETLRLFPSLFKIGRKCVRKYVIPATDTTPSIKLNVGDRIWIPTYVLHRDPVHFPDPERFDPERFSEANKKDIAPCTYMPFGTGPRMCIGMRFAQMDVKIAIASILSRFNLVVIDKTAIDNSFGYRKVQLMPPGGYWLGIKPRTKLPKAK